MLYEKVKEFTKVFLHIINKNQEEKEKETIMDLGDNFQVFELEKKRIIETHGVIKVECQ